MSINGVLMFYFMLERNVFYQDRYVTTYVLDTCCSLSIYLIPLNNQFLHIYIFYESFLNLVNGSNDFYLLGKGFLERYIDLCRINFLKIYQKKISVILVLFLYVLNLYYMKFKILKEISPGD